MILHALAALVSLAAAAPNLAWTGDPFDQVARLPRIILGPLKVGEDHPLFDLDDFPVSVEPAGSPVTARWIPGSIRWVRSPDALPLPVARLEISAAVPAQRALLRWRGRAVLFQGDAAPATTEVWVPLLEGSEGRVDVDGKSAAKLRVGARALPATPISARHGIDHSCSPYALTLSGLDDVLLSANCRLAPVGRVGAEQSFLEVRWAAAGLTLPDGSAPPLSAQLRDARPARLTVIGPDGRSRVIELSAAVAARWHRLRLAAGAGPYHFSSTAHAGNGYAGSLMLYANLRARPEDALSVRAFEAAVSQSPTATAFFNNLGLYFAYDLAHVWDRRLRLTALLGVQTVTFAERGLSHSSYNEGLFPQGFEFTYLDAFGRRNKTLSGGLFLQPTSNKHYQNYWVRYGGRVFGELNYLSWRSGSRSAHMSGLSVGVPFAQLF